MKKSLHGGRRGVWRLLDQMDRNQVTASFLVTGYAAEKFPEAMVEIKKGGHEIAAYGYITSRRLSNMKPDEEKSEIFKTLHILGKVTGFRPRGSVSPDCFPGDLRTVEIARCTITVAQSELLTEAVDASKIIFRRDTQVPCLVE